MKVSVIEVWGVRIEARMLCEVILGCLWMTLASQVAVSLPFTTVPITLGPQAAIFLGMFIGPRRGASSVALWAWMGLNGAPVFPGLGAFVDPTMGYIFGYILAAGMMGMFKERIRFLSAGKVFSAALASLVPIYLCGLSWLALYVPIEKVLTFGFWPFLPGIFIKTTLMSLAATLLKRWR